MRVGRPLVAGGLLCVACITACTLALLNHQQGQSGTEQLTRASALAAKWLKYRIQKDEGAKTLPTVKITKDCDANCQVRARARVCVCMFERV